MARDQTDPAFVRFTTMAYGYRAAFCLLRTYRVKYGYNTIRKIIKRWAPPSENNTERYIQNVSKWSGIEPDKLLAGQDANAYIQIVAAMSRMENGKPLSPLSPKWESASQSESAGAVKNGPYSDEWMMEQIVQGYRMI